MAQAAPATRLDSDAILMACDQLPACRGHLDQADRFYEENRYDDAIQAYQAAYGLQPYPLILFNIARIYHKQQQLSQAAEYYQRYLNTADPQQAERTRQLLKEVQDELKKTRPSQPVPSSSAAQAASEQASLGSASPAEGAKAQSTVNGTTRIERPPPRGRLIAGGVLLGGGLILSGFGVAGLAANGHCQDGSMNFDTCSQYYDTTAVGGSLLGIGGALLLSGTILLAIPRNKSPQLTTARINSGSL